MEQRAASWGLHTIRVPPTQEGLCTGLAAVNLTR